MRMPAGKGVRFCSKNFYEGDNAAENVDIAFVVYYDEGMPCKHGLQKEVSPK